MKNLLFILAVTLFLPYCSRTPVVSPLHGDLVIEKDSIRKRIRFYSPNIVRVTAIKQPREVRYQKPGSLRVVTVAEDGAFHDSSLAVIAEPGEVDLTLERQDDYLLVKSDSLTLRIRRRDAAITFLTPQGRVLLQETERPGLQDTTVAGKGYYKAWQSFRLTPTEGLYGLGQFQNGRMNWRNSDLTLVQANKIAIVPVLVSTNGYSILWDNYSHTDFHDGPGGMSFTSHVAKQLDYYFTASATIDGLVAGYRHLTGRAPMFKRKAYGYWQSRERYSSFGEMQDVLRRYRKAGIPVDNIVQDWQYWGDNNHWSSMRFNPATYPHPAENIRKIHDLHADLMVSIWPALGSQTAIYKEMEQKGFLYPPVHWSGGRIYDAYNPEARAIYWRYIRDGLMRYGVDALWMDATEPELYFVDNQQQTEEKLMEAEKTFAGPTAEYLNTYALVSTQGVYENFRKDVPEKRAFILTRSSWAGQQRNATVTWSGDLRSGFATMRRQIPAGINFCMAGVPYWTFDIGGFFPSRLGGSYPKEMDDPAYQELYVRWFQYGAFAPIFRSHGTGKPREIYHFQKPLFYDALKKALQLRYRLLPYIYSLAWQVTAHDYTLMRGLVMDFPRDTAVYNIPDQYMFGPAFLVKPVTRSMYYEIGGKKKKLTPEALTVPVYLPAGTGWFDYRTRRYYPGGKTVSLAYPIDIFPLFVREGSIIPIGPDVQYADEQPYALKEILVFAGRDASFVYYEDGNNNYDYEKGQYNTIRFDWNDRERKLTIGESTGHFPGLVKGKDFRIVVVTPPETAGGAGLTESRLCHYKGDLMVIDFFHRK